MTKITAKEITYTSFLIVLNIILTRIASIRLAVGGVEVVRIGFGSFPVILAGIILGPFAGGIVGAVGDIIGYTINPMGVYMPHFTLTAALRGIIPGLVIKFFKTDDISIWHIVTAVFIGQMITSVLLVSYFLHMLFGIPLWYRITSSAINQLINIPVYSVFVRMLMKKLNLQPKYLKS